MKDDEIEIEIEIDMETGEVISETHGIKGSSCIDEIEELLAKEVLITEHQKKDEYFQDGEVRTKLSTKEKVGRST